MRLIPLLCLLLLVLCRPACAGQKSVTFYLDGVRVEHETTAVRGYLEYPLPESLAPGSLRVKPSAGGKVLRVEVVPADKDRRRAPEVARLEERKSRLLERLQMLERREEIFTAAAKTQSGKSPRKTKADPDPLTSLQQGTDFALGQLEAICRSRLRCQKEIEALDRKIASARKGAAMARIWLSGRKATVSFVAGNERWIPSYDFRWSGDDGGELLMHARLPRLEKGARYFVCNGTVADCAGATPVRGDYPEVARHPLTLLGSSRRDERPVSFTFSPVEAALPAGEASVFWRGEYLGSARFPGGGASRLVLGAD